MRHSIMLLWLALIPADPLLAQQVSIDTGFPEASIGIDLPALPNLVPVPGYPVYYAPDVATNFFFYDGLFWVFQDGNWFASSWYNGPWALVSPESVPLFVLRIPVRYYRSPPQYFRSWQSDAPPHWDERWGHEWARRRHGWDQWDRDARPAPAPLPLYQREYWGERYPRRDEQRELQRRHDPHMAQPPRQQPLPPPAAVIPQRPPEVIPQRPRDQAPQEMPRTVAPGFAPPPRMEIPERQHVPQGGSSAQAPPPPAPTVRPPQEVPRPTPQLAPLPPHPVPVTPRPPQEAPRPAPQLAPPHPPAARPDEHPHGGREEHEEPHHP